MSDRSVGAEQARSGRRPDQIASQPLGPRTLRGSLLTLPALKQQRSQARVSAGHARASRSGRACLALDRLAQPRLGLFERASRAMHEPLERGQLGEDPIVRRRRHLIDARRDGAGVSQPAVELWPCRRRRAPHR